MKKLSAQYIHTTLPRREALTLTLPPLSPKTDLTSPINILRKQKRENVIVHDEYVQELAIRAWSAYDAKQYEEADQLSEEALYTNAAVDSSTEYSTLHGAHSLWRYVARSMPLDIGGCPQARAAIKEILSRYCVEGNILEAFAGYNSYIESTSVNNVIALDYCKEALEKYPHPERTRIKFNLNRLTKSSQIGVFPDEYFNAVTICFGYKYPERLRPVFSEFRRILKPGGKLLMVEHACMGYVPIVKRWDFVPEVCEKYLRRSGFNSVSITDLPIQIAFTATNGMKFVEAIK